MIIVIEMKKDKVLKTIIIFNISFYDYSNINILILIY